jgi:hypothetical protein
LRNPNEPLRQPERESNRSQSRPSSFRATGIPSVIFLIHTCELNRANPFDYLTELLRHRAELKASPADWMPWNYRDTLARIAASPKAPARHRPTLLLLVR